LEQTTVAEPEELLGRLTEPELKAAPPLLYLRGDPALIEYGPRVAVVGSRRASPEGLELAKRITVELVRQDVTVVSGLALGIDTVAHRTALACGGKTVAVLGTAISQYAVERNRSLQDEIGAHGLLVSQFPCGDAPHRSNFPRRNRTMALLSDATVIVEAGERSGTRHMGWEADPSCAAGPVPAAAQAKNAVMARPDGPVRCIRIRQGFPPTGPGGTAPSAARRLNLVTTSRSDEVKLHFIDWQLGSRCDQLVLKIDARVGQQCMDSLLDQ